MATTFYDSFIGVFTGYPWLNRPDTKFKEGGLYHTGFRGSGKEAEAMAAKIEAFAQEAFEDHMVNAFPDEKERNKARKQWSIHLPFERETDDDDNPTGAIVFEFKQNATIKIKKTGELKTVQIGLYDAEGNEMHSPIYGGSEGRVRYSLRATPMVSQKKVGVRLDFAAVQISKLATGSSGGGGFGKIEGGYVEDSSAGGFGSINKDQEGSGPDQGGDY